MSNSNLIPVDLEGFSLDEFDAIEVQSEELRKIFKNEINKHLIFSGVMNNYLQNSFGDIDVDDSYWCVFEPEVIGSIHSTFNAFGANVAVAFTRSLNEDNLDKHELKDACVVANQNAIRQALSVGSEYVVSELVCCSDQALKKQVEILEEAGSEGYILYADEKDSTLDACKTIREVSSRPLVVNINYDEINKFSVSELIDKGATTIGVIFDNLHQLVSASQKIKDIQDQFNIKCLVEVDDIEINDIDSMLECAHKLNLASICAVRAGASASRTSCALFYAQF